MAQSQLRTGPNMKLVVAYQADTGELEKTIGFASGITFTVAQGQKAIFVVDSPFAGEIAQGAGPSFVRGTVTLYLPKGTNPVRAGLVSPTSGSVKDDTKSGEVSGDFPRQATSKYLNWRFIDRYTHELSYAINYCKVGTWSIVHQAKSHVVVTLNFEGMYVQMGPS